ncbi:MAG TPA: T9SS type A sorting domain-containing protein [Bacteroidia bacterium]|nr:T9SS type A sorting domain-containing protein [Bacteroidia bacterium]
MKKLFTLAFLLPVAATMFAQPANVNVSNTTYFEGEPYVAVNPTNHNNVVIAWMALDVNTLFRVGIKTKVSFDGGLTWGNMHVQPHFGSGWGSADVSMQFRSNGTLYLSYIDYKASADSGGVFITHSLDGGITWSAPTQVWNANTEDPSKLPLDRPWLAADNSGTANDGMFYITTKPAPWIPAPNRPYLKVSSDSGQTWSAYRYIDTTNYLVGNIIQAPMATLTTSADGALCIAYPSYLASQSVYPKIFFAKSYNHGNSFTYHDLLVGGTPVTDTLYKLGYRLAANPSNPNQLAYAFMEQPYGDPDIFICTTNDGGNTWSAPLRVNDDAQGNGKAQDMVWADYDTNGKLVVTWRDRRNGSGTGFYQSSDTYCAVSTDNGATFMPNMRLSSMTAPFDSILEQKGNDFLSCRLLNDTIYAAWGDVRTGNLNIFFAKTSDSTGITSTMTTVDGEENDISVYPNPSSDKIVLSFGDEMKQPVTVKIFSGNGQQVMAQSFAGGTLKATMDISQLGAGVYFISIESGKNILQTKKLVITR